MGEFSDNLPPDVSGKELCLFRVEQVFEPAGVRMKYETENTLQSNFLHILSECCKIMNPHRSKGHCSGFLQEIYNFIIVEANNLGVDLTEKSKQISKDGVSRLRMLSMLVNSEFKKAEITPEKRRKFSDDVLNYIKNEAIKYFQSA